MNTEVVSSDEELKVTLGGFYSGEWERKKNHNPAQMLRLRSEPLDSYFTVGCLVETVFQAFNDECASSQASEALAKWQK